MDLLEEFLFEKIALASYKTTYGTMDEIDLLA